MLGIGASERRLHRTGAPNEAIAAYLTRLAASAGLVAIALSDEAGNVVGYSRGIDLASLARVGVACARGEDDGSALPGDDDLFAHSWEDDGTTFYLASLGGRVPRVREVRRTVRRIRGALDG